jgi:DNA-binding IclR family transcriptional regulator
VRRRIDRLAGFRAWEVLGAISVASPTQRFNPEVIAANRPQVRHAAEQISINLGWCKP